MTFNTAIEKTMPEVQSGSTEPFVIYRDSNGGWHFDFTQNQFGEKFDWVEEASAKDPLAVMYTGKDFSNASFSSVYDTVLYDRIRSEYYIAGSSGRDSDSLHALTCFFYENVSAFSHEVTDYLTTLERPLAALAEMCPFNLATDYEGWSFNKDLAPDALDYIQNAVYDRLHIKDQNIVRAAAEMTEAEINVSEYKPLMTTNLAGWQVTLAENHSKSEPYLVEWRREPDKGIPNDTYFCGVTSDYLEAMTEFTRHLQLCVNVARTNRDVKKSLHNIEYIQLSTGDCLPDSHNDDYTGKLIIVKAGELKPEHRSAEDQLVLCSHGNGARPNAIGTSVFGKELFSGESVCYGRHQIAGIADPAKLPRWAKLKLAEMKAEQSHQKVKPADKKPSILGKLDGNKQKVERDKAEKKDMPATKKRGVKEVTD